MFKQERKKKKKGNGKESKKWKCEGGKPPQLRLTNPD